MSKSGGLEYTKVAEIRALLVVDEVIPELKSAIAVLEPNWVQTPAGHPLNAA